MSSTPSNFTEYDFANENEEDVEEPQNNNTVSPFDIPIEDLIDRRDRYINELKLEKAQELDAIIDYIQNTAHEGPVQKVKDYLENKFIEFYNQYKENCKRLQELADDNEIEIRKEGDDAFVEMKAKHIGQLIEIEKMRAYEIIFNKNKPVKKALIYERQARYSAKQKEYDKAYHFRQQASQEKERVHNERKQQVEEKMSNLKSNVFSTMRSEMKVLAEKIQDQIKNNQALLNEELDLQFKAFKVQVNSEIQKAINGLNNYITKNETKRTLANEISVFSDSKLQEITGMEMNITVSIPSSPPNNSKSRSQTVSPTPMKSSTQTIKVQISPRQTTPRQEKQRKQQNSPKPQKEEQNQEEKQTNQEENQIKQEEVQNVPNVENHKEEEEKKTEIQNQQQEQEKPKDEQEIEQLKEENQELQNQINAIVDVNSDANEKDDDFNIDNLIDNENNQLDSVDKLLLNENSNNNDEIGLNLDDSGNVNENEIGAGSDKKSSTDAILSNLLNGDDDPELLDILGEGNSNKVDGSSDILNIGED